MEAKTVKTRCGVYGDNKDKQVSMWLKTGCALGRSVGWYRTKPHHFRNLVASARISFPPSGNGKAGASEIPSTVEESSVEEYATPNNTAGPVPAPSPSSFLENLSNDTVDASGTNWAKSYHGLSSEPFSQNIADILQAPLDPEDVEMKPGMLRPFLT